MNKEGFLQEEGDEYDYPSPIHVYERKKKLVKKYRPKDTVHKKYMNDLPIKFSKSNLLKKNSTNIKGAGPI